VKWAIKYGTALVVYGDMEHTVVHTQIHVLHQNVKVQNELCKNYAIILQSGILICQRLAKVLPELCSYRFESFHEGRVKPVRIIIMLGVGREGERLKKNITRDEPKVALWTPRQANVGPPTPSLGFYLSSLCLNFWIGQNLGK